MPPYKGEPMKNITPTTNRPGPGQAANQKAMREKDRTMVKGIFRFYEAPGHTMGFVFRAYPEDPVETFNLKDGEAYTIPLGVAKHLNKNGWYPEYEFTSDRSFQSGHSVSMGSHVAPSGGMKIGKRIRRFGFQSMDFIDELQENTQQIVTVENI